jgi:hypothetical protein
MVTMGALQPGLHTPACIPKEWPLIVLDLQDCFYTISIHCKDRERFAFSIPGLNQQEPLQRYQWIVLPQGMTNSPEGLKDGLREVPKGNKWSRRHFFSLGNACLHLKGISCDQAM